jgi:hypothetical protein
MKMTGRRAIVGLSLLCALAFCAFAAPSASAAGTTAVTCVETPKGEGFSDAHCDNAVSEGATFKHEAIPANTTTEIELTNEKTTADTKGAVSSLLTGELGGVKAVEITCKTVKGTGSLTNKEEKGSMLASGSATIEHSECVVAKPAGCIVKEPILYEANFKTYGNETEMGVEFTGAKAGEFGAITYKNKGAEKCVFNEKTIGISGAFKGRPGNAPQGKGATLWFDDGETLKWSTSLYDLTGAMTWRMKGGGDPIAFTT